MPLLTSSVGLLVLLMYFPGGLVQIGYSARDALFAGSTDACPSAEPSPKPTARASSPRTATEQRARSSPTCCASTDATSRPLRRPHRRRRASASTSVAHEVVGLIGTNGAGKTTLMNAIGGYVPAAGRIELLGADVSRPVRRATARRGSRPHLPSRAPLRRPHGPRDAPGRARGSTPHGLHQHRAVPPAWLPGRSAPARRRRGDPRTSSASAVTPTASAPSCRPERVASSSSARLLALDARVLCLDEPTAGVAQRETEAFGPLLLRIRDELDASLLVIEHDMPLIMSISDRVYCLEAGRVIAEGTPSAVRDDPAVVASYLGTDQRAIQRSGIADLTHDLGGPDMSAPLTPAMDAPYFALAALATACTTSPKHELRRRDATSGTGNGGALTASARGVTATTIKVGFAYIDLETLAKPGIIKIDHGPYAADHQGARRRRQQGRRDQWSQAPALHGQVLADRQHRRSSPRARS